MSVHLEVTTASSSLMTEPLTAQIATVRPSAFAATGAAQPQRGKLGVDPLKDKEEFGLLKFFSYDAEVCKEKKKEEEEDEEEEREVKEAVTITSSGLLILIFDVLKPM